LEAITWRRWRRPGRHVFGGLIFFNVVIVGTGLETTGVAVAAVALAFRGWSSGVFSVPLFEGLKLSFELRQETATRQGHRQSRE